MNTQLILFLVMGFVCLLGILLGVFMFWQKGKIEKELIAERSKYAELERSLQKEREEKLAKVRAKREAEEERQNALANELIELRKSVARFKAETQKLRTEIAQREKELKAVEEQKELSLYKLLEEKRVLLEQLREADKKLSEFAREQTESAELRQMRQNLAKASEEFSALQRKHDDLERDYRMLKEKHETLLENHHKLQQEINKWREAASFVSGKYITPELFLRWYRRAIRGREMYQMMKQLRELSDIKLTTYQDSIVKLCEFVFAVKNVEPPALSAKDVKSDKYLGKALELIVKEAPENTAAHSVVAKNTVHESSI